MDDDNTPFHDAEAISVEDLQQNEIRAGKLLVHLAKQNAIGGRRHLFEHESRLINETFSIADKNSDTFRRYFVEAIRIAIATVNFRLAEILLTQSPQPDLLKEELFILHSAISGDFRNEGDTSNEQPHWVREPRKLLDDAGILPRIVRLLVKFGAPIDAVDDKGRTPLYATCFSVRQRTFEYLLSIGADSTTLHDPVENGDLDHIQVATSEPNSIGSKINLLQIALASRLRHETRMNDDFHYFPLKDRGGELILALMDKGLKCPRNDPALAKFLEMASFEGNVPYVQRILDHGVEIGARAGRSYSGEYYMGSPLHIATIHAHKEVVGLLLSAGALPSMQRNVHMKKWYMCRCNDMGCGHCKFMTPIEYAVDSIYMERIAHKRNPEHLLQCIDTILNAGANNEDAELVLREAARLDNISLLKKVLEGDRPISTVPLSKNISAIEMCIDAGIPIDNRRFQLYALQQGSRELMKYLLTKSRPLLPVSIMGEIIWWLVDRNFFDLAELLIEVYAVNIDQVWTIDFSFDYSDFKEFSCWFAPSKELLWQDCNLLQRAVTTYYPTKDQIRFVLECGALVECPGLPLNALEYCKEAAKISELDCFRLLLEYAKKQDFLHIPVVCERVSSVTSSSTAPDNHESLIWHFARSELATPGLGAPDSQAALAIEVEADGIRSTVKQLAASNLAEVPKSPSTQTLDIPARDSAQDVLDAMSAHRTAVDQSLHPFIHQPLEGLHFIRLFELELSTSTHDPIRGHLKHVNLSEAPHFEALSYVWGDARVKIPIILGDSRFEVTLNLWNALFRMRGANSSQLLWIDSMCIDQQNEQEKSHQVQMMREIYLSADNVIIWLGEQSTSGENDLLHAVNSLDPELAQKALERIASKPWFYRTWTMQEIVLAKRATIKISGQTCDWGDIKSLKKTSESYSGSSYLPFHGLSPNQHLSRLRDLCSLDVNDPNSNTRTAQMFLYSSVCEATDPRDKVYGLLGMFEGPLINVDYTLGADIIYRRFTEAIIKRSGSLKILYKFGTKKTIDGLPSWVPDYSVSRPAGVIPECYNDWLEDQDLGLPRTIKFVDDALILTGIPFSKINATGDVLSEDTALGVTIGSEAFRKVLSGWESLACTLDANVFEQPLPICFLETITAQDYRQETVYNSAGMLDWYNKYGAGPTKLHDKQPFIDYQDRMELESWLSDSKDRETRQGESAMIITMPGNGAHPKVEEWGGRPKGGPEAHIARLTRRLEQVCYSRCFFTTEKGDMGLAPEGTQAGDVVVYFECGLFPFVLRQREDGKWKMVGGCFHYQREFTEEEIEGVNKALRESVAEFVIV